MKRKDLISNDEIDHFKKELKIYMGVVLIPINIVFVGMMFIKGVVILIPLSVLVLMNLYYYRTIRQTFQDIKNNDYIVKTGVLKRKIWGFNLNKFEYFLRDDNDVFASFISRFNVFENHEVKVIYTKHTHKIIKMYKI